jgi:hypothetical protein
MFDYQLYFEAYCIKNGIDQEKDNSKIVDTDDLDDLYGAYQ